MSTVFAGLGDARENREQCCLANAIAAAQDLAALDLEGDILERRELSAVSPATLARPCAMLTILRHAAPCASTSDNAV
jgi:hypothetical protein